MKPEHTSGIVLRSCMPLALAIAMAPHLHGSQYSAPARREIEAFLLNARIVQSGPASPKQRSWRVTLDDGQRKHEAWVNTSTPDDAQFRNYRLNVAAYELDKLVGLNFVVPAVERAVGGRPASVTWWADGVLMSEQERRRQQIEPPASERWNEQVQAVRVFDELVANAYRDVDPSLYTSSIWDNLLITTDWNIWLVDHTRTFQVTTRLGHTESLSRCDRSILAALRALDRATFQQHLGKFLTGEQLDALEARRASIVKHFDESIARKGERAVLYDLSRK